MRLRELQDLERLLTAMADLGDAPLADCVEALEATGDPRADAMKTLADAAARLGPRHLNAVRELKGEERKKGVVDFACAW
jgi:hypothetical protein